MNITTMTMSKFFLCYVQNGQSDMILTDKTTRMLKSCPSFLLSKSDILSSILSLYDWTCLSMRLAPLLLSLKDVAFGVYNKC